MIRGASGVAFCSILLAALAPAHAAILDPPSESCAIPDAELGSQRPSSSCNKPLPDSHGHSPSHFEDQSALRSEFPPREFTCDQSLERAGLRHDSVLIGYVSAHNNAHNTNAAAIGSPSVSQNGEATPFVHAERSSASTRSHSQNRIVHDASAYDPRQRGAQAGFEVGFHVIRIPSAILSPFLDSYSNALCRPEPGAMARSMGVNRSDACNFGIRAGYRRVWNRLVARIEFDYTRLHMPDSNWVARGETIPAADFVQVDFHAVGISSTILREYPLGKAPTRWSWRVGGQFGVALLLGGLYRTKLGAQHPECESDDLGDLETCRPYRPLEFSESGRDPRYFADCDNERGCRESDLERAGRQRQDTIPPIIPLLNFVTGPRFAITPDTAMSLNLGLGIGVSLGLSVDYRLQSLGPTWRN